MWSQSTSEPRAGRGPVVDLEGRDEHPAVVTSLDRSGQASQQLIIEFHPHDPDQGLAWGRPVIHALPPIKKPTPPRATGEESAYHERGTGHTDEPRR
jgi:hypothetical protein